MANTEKYYVGPKLLGEIREVISRVSGMPDSTSGVSMPVRLQQLQRPGGGGAMRLGKVTATWNKDSLRDVVVYGDGEALAEEAASPPVVVTECVNKFSTVLADRWVIIGKMHGRWYLIAAEC